VVDARFLVVGLLGPSNGRGAPHVQDEPSSEDGEGSLGGLLGMSF
jgi:hypothetical protein